LTPSPDETLDSAPPPESADSRETLPPDANHPDGRSSQMRFLLRSD
jgi:hypothetical protein